MDNCTCIICENSMINLSQGGNQPSGGLEFYTQGHYESAEFDPMDNTSLAIDICDICLVALRKKQLILCVNTSIQPRPKPTYSIWGED